MKKYAEYTPSMYPLRKESPHLLEQIEILVNTFGTQIIFSGSTLNIVTVFQTFKNTFDREQQNKILEETKDLYNAKFFEPSFYNSGDDSHINYSMAHLHQLMKVLNCVNVVYILDNSLIYKLFRFFKRSSRDTLEMLFKKCIFPDELDRQLISEYLNH